MSSFSARERNDLRELFRVHDFAKMSRVDEIVAATSTTPAALFASLYAQYHIAPLPDRAEATARLQAAVPEASAAEVESAIRVAEVKGFHEADALRALRRELRATKTAAPLSADDTNAAKGVTMTPAKEDRVAGTATVASQQAAPVSRQIAAIEAKLHHVDPTSTTATDLTRAVHAKAKGKAGERAAVAAKDRSGSSLTSTPKRASKHEQAHDRHVGESGAAKTRMTTQRPQAEAEVLTTPVVPTLGTLTAPPTADSTDHIVAEEVREWVATVVGDRFGAPVRAAASVMDALKDGVVLLVLLQKLRDPPVADAALKLPRRTTGFFMRDNVSTFLREAKAQFGLTEAQLFTNSDLCDGKDERQVVTCLLAIARQAYSRNATLAAPAMVRFEKEIDAMTNKLTQDDLERIVREAEAEAQTRETAAEGSEGSHDAQAEQEGSGAGAREDEAGEAGDAIGDAVAQEAVVQDAIATEDTSEEAEAEEHADSTAVAKEGAADDATPRDTRDEAATPEHGGSPVAVTPAPEASAPPSEPRGTAPGEGGEEKETAVTQAVSRLLGSSPSSHRHSRQRASHSMPRIVYKPRPDEPRQTLPPRYHPQHWDGIDIALANVVNAHYQCQPDSAWRFRAVLSQPGEYVMYNRQTGERRQVHVRVIQDRVLLCKAAAPATVAGGPRSWVDLAGALTQLEGRAQLETE